MNGSISILGESTNKYHAVKWWELTCTETAAGEFRTYYEQPGGCKEVEQDRHSVGANRWDEKAGLQWDAAACMKEATW